MNKQDLEHAISVEGTMDNINIPEDVQFFLRSNWKDLTQAEMDFEYVAEENIYSSDDNSYSKDGMKSVNYKQTKITDYFGKKFGMMGDLNNPIFNFAEVNMIQDTIDLNEEHFYESTLKEFVQLQKDDME